MNTSNTEGALAVESLITLHNVHKSYAAPGGAEHHALRGLSLTVARGEYLALLGKSGSGKSTVLNLIAGLDEATTGEVKVDGVAPASMGESARATWRGARVGVVFQFFQLLPTLSVVENILLAMEFVRVIPKSERRARAYAGLAAVGIADHADW
jgi:putative ABC transport system ATP-binding protein